MSEELPKISLENNSYLPKKIWKEIDTVSNTKKLSSSQKEKLIDAVNQEYMRSMFEPGEAIGIVSAQSISEPATQMSIIPYEKIVLKRNGRIAIVEIGKFTDSLVKEMGKNIDGWDICDISSENIYVPSITDKEKIKWSLVKACSRHKSPGKLLQITTFSGRQITTTDSHSFVIRKDNKIVPIAGSDLRIGDRVPVMKYLPENCINEINIPEYMADRVKESSGLLYTTKHSKPIPNKLNLDFYFGWFVGAYLSEGSCSGNQVRISNISEPFISNASTFAENIGLDFKDRSHMGEFGISRTLTINSSVLSKFMVATCGVGSRNKKVPNFAYSANEEFVSGLLRGYFDGDGNIHPERKLIRVFSNSKELLNGICILLSRFGIFAHKKKSKNQYGLLIPYKYAPIFLENIGSDIPKKREGLERMTKMAEHFWNSKSQDFTDMINGFGDLFYRTAKKLKYPTRYMNNFTKRQKIGRTTIYRYMKLFEKIAAEKKIDISFELELIRNMFYSDVIWDKIISIEYVNPDFEYVYDLTVEGTETFTTFEGIVTHNTMRTFHFAASAGVQITLGLPRLIEIFDARRESTTPIMTLYLKSKNNTQPKAEEFAKNIREKRLRNYVNTISIDLTNKKIKIETKKIKKFVLKEIVDRIEKILKNYKIKILSNGIEIEPQNKEVSIKELEQVKKKLLALHVMGLQGVKNTIVIKEGKDWVIKTLGSNFAKVILLEEVDHKKCYSNNIHEIAKVLGIEAARASLIKEINETIQQQGLDIDERHINLVADIMTLTGDIKAVGRYGVAGMKSSVLAKAGFEETIKHLVRASIRNEIDTFDGIFDNVMINRQIPVGTGMFELIAKIGEEDD